jgi:methyltransferase family protein
MGDSGIMLYLLKRAARRVGLTEPVRELLQKIDPAEREFRLVWPSIDRVEGFLVSPMQERWLFKTARSLLDGSTIVEIGSFKGRSTCALAYGCRGTNKHLFAIDTFEGNNSDFKQGGIIWDGQSFDKNFLDIFCANIEKNGLTRYVTPIPGLSSQVAKTWGKPIHLLFIDGSHQYEDVLADFESFYPHVVSNGIVAFHDVEALPNGEAAFPGVTKVWEEVALPLLTHPDTCSTLAFGRKSSAH